ncbi:tripartite ATP-independent transporter DctP family solute receptor [Planomicrobium soli]|uniref:Tripartite ATP-independent transporter DctP family solute receptor n=1 Tax=Planomicrobium soli TaxID=1176648 RepID=A0A2P8H5Q3_9BACL|nr:TRAP transporter substrate-binding protein [Planomicrobium soli]PSL41565.1 tripartite ATP-independent transporter DctP family solute receptor [Planomicrobium soli]
MKLRKLLSLSILGSLTGLMLAGCATSNAAGEDGHSTTLRIAHSLAEDHPIHQSITQFADLAHDNSDGAIGFEVYPNGQLGQERGTIEMVKSGLIDMAKVSASGLESFSSSYSIFSLPYVFQSKEHYYEVMNNSEAVQEIFQSTRDDGFIVINWYDGGQRSIYTADKKVESPADMNGMKIRVQESPTSIAMIKAMGGAPTPMSFGEVYTSLQQGVIDGAESNETALTNSKHGEVSKAYTYTEHQYVPDLLIISTNTWDSLSTEQQQALKDAAAISSESHIDVWAEAIDQAILEAKEMGVAFYEIDKQPFIDAARPLHESYQSQNADYERYFKDFQSYAN